MDEVVMTYQEIAKLRGVSIAAVRRMAYRYKWRRVQGNDGIARVYIPAHYIPAEEPPVAAASESDPLIEWLLESARMAEERARRAEERADAAEARMDEMRRDFMVSTRRFNEELIKAFSQPWLHTRHAPETAPQTE
jgi:hypothetical protein